MTAPQRMCELFKLLRSQALSRAEIADHMEAHGDTVSAWTDELVASGMLLERKSEEHTGKGRAPVLYRLAPEWGGQA